MAAITLYLPDGLRKWIDEETSTGGVLDDVSISGVFQRAIIAEIQSRRSHPRVPARAGQR